MDDEDDAIPYDLNLGIGNREILNALQWIAALLVLLAVLGGIGCWLLWRLVDAAG